jgi:hypothetical protein
MTGYLVGGVVALALALIVVVIVKAKQAQAARLRAWSAFVDRHGLRRASPHEQPWTSLFLFGLAHDPTFSDVFEGQVNGVSVTVCNTSAGLSSGGSKNNVGTVALVPLERADLPECLLIPAQTGAMLGRVLEMLGPSLGIQLNKVPQQPELSTLYTVIGPAGADLDSALGALDLLDLLAKPAQAMAFGRGWLAVFPATRGKQWIRLADSEEDLEQLLRAALELRPVVSALAP